MDFNDVVRSKESRAERLSLEDRMDAMEWEIVMLKKDNGELKEKLPKLEVQVNQLQAKIQTIEAEKTALRRKIEAEPTTFGSRFSYAYFAER